MRRIKVEDIISCLSDDDEIFGITSGIEIEKPSSVEQADELSVSWISEKKKDKSLLVSKSKARIIICDKSFDLPESILNEKCVIRTNDPRLLFIRVLNSFFTEKKSGEIHPTAVIHKEAEISENVFIGAHVYIGKCMINSGCIIDPNCTLYDDVRLGRNVVIHSGTVIGSDGFGYSRNESGIMEKFPQLGGVVIGDDVEIGANTCIDRGTLNDTVIESGCKIDNLVHIAHNVIIGKHSVIIAHAMIGGSTVIEEQSWVAPSAALMNGIRIGKNSVIGLGAVITKSVPDNETWIGNPGAPISKFLAVQKVIKGLLSNLSKNEKE